MTSHFNLDVCIVGWLHPSSASWTWFPLPIHPRMRRLKLSHDSTDSNLCIIYPVLSKLKNIWGTRFKHPFYGYVPSFSIITIINHPDLRDGNPHLILSWPIARSRCRTAGSPKMRFPPWRSRWRMGRSQAVRGCAPENPWTHGAWKVEDEAKGEFLSIATICIYIILYVYIIILYYIYIYIHTYTCITMKYDGIWWNAQAYIVLLAGKARVQKDHITRIRTLALPYSSLSRSSSNQFFLVLASIFWDSINTTQYLLIAHLISFNCCIQL